MQGKCSIFPLIIGSCERDIDGYSTFNAGWNEVTLPMVVMLLISVTYASWRESEVYFQSGFLSPVLGCSDVCLLKLFCLRLDFG